MTNKVEYIKSSNNCLSFVKDITEIILMFLHAVINRQFKENGDRNDVMLLTEKFHVISFNKGVRVRASWQAYVRSFGIVVSII